MSNCSEESLKQHLQHLEVRLDTFAIDPAESVADNPTPTRDLIFSRAVSGKDEDPLVVYNEFEGDNGRGNHVYVIWGVPAFLSKDKYLGFEYMTSMLMVYKSVLVFASNTHPSFSSHLLV